MTATKKSVSERRRMSFGSSRDVIDLPDLIQIQRVSYDSFLYGNKGKESGLVGVFKSVFPISDFSNSAVLEFVSCKFGRPKFDVKECRARGGNFALPLKVMLRLIVFEVDESTGARSVKDIKEQEVYMGDIPCMTESGTFVINGTERAVVSQMHKSPGVFFHHDKGRTHYSGTFLYSAKIIPYRGSWVDIEFDSRDILYVRIDRKRKIPATSFLMSFGYDRESILENFYDPVDCQQVQDGWVYEIDPNILVGRKPVRDVVSAKTGQVVFASGKKITARTIEENCGDKTLSVFLTEDNFKGMYIAQDMVSQKGEILFYAGQIIDEDVLERFLELGIKKVKAFDIDGIYKTADILSTLELDPAADENEALTEVYKVLRPGELPSVDAARSLFQSIFSDPDRFDLSAVGRVKMNMRLNFEPDDTVGILRPEDVLAIIKTLVDLKVSKGEVDDIDNLGNRRVRCVGELVENHYQLGLVRIERAIKERMSSLDLDTVMPQDLINTKPISATVREFFGSSQLSQFMEQVNPLAEITHKRRLSSMGPGGLTRERAGFEVRDVHHTHYGRVCPVETPEGPNIGLISSLATFARVNKYGFIETPYRKVVDCKVTDEVVYLSAMEENGHYIAQVSAKLDENNKLSEDLVTCRYSGNTEMISSDKVTYMDVSSKQSVSVAASLVPFLENNDAKRDLMASNMQRQAVPVLRAEAPIVGTGMEGVVARDSGSVLKATRSGVVEQVDAMRIVVRATDNLEESKSGIDIYSLLKFQRSNQSTCINQKPLVNVGDVVKAGDVIADGSSTDQGELALGKNLSVAFMSWNGYNFEDSIVISERVVKDDVFTSIHLEEFDIMARDTKLGPEEITRDIPNVSDEALSHLDESGIVHVGAEVEAGDILVGMITPKGDSPVTPEEKLLRAIFGEKSSDVRDSSLRLPPGSRGTVVEVRVFNRHGVEKDSRSLAIERIEIDRLSKESNHEQSIVDKHFLDTLCALILGKKVSGPNGIEVCTQQLLDAMPKSQWWSFELQDQKLMEQVKELRKKYDSVCDRIGQSFLEKVERIQLGDDLKPGVLKQVKIFVAVKRSLQAGDKMAGRHGNKGVVSRIVPVEDMPYLEDGTSVDIVLNPLGVPSRLNIGQVLETHLGWACVGVGAKVRKLIENVNSNRGYDELKQFLNKVYGNSQDTPKLETKEEILSLSDSTSKWLNIATPVFDGAREKDISDLLELSGLSKSGQVDLYDGKTGEKFERPVTVGYMYLLKLNHMVDDKIHARSVGPYSLVTQQPLGGKAQFGGQRFGEMEVWALEAYGAAYTLQEMLTVKSDDVSGRTKVYESIIRGETSFQSSVPESFNVLVKEMRALGLDVELSPSDENSDDSSRLPLQVGDS